MTSAELNQYLTEKRNQLNQTRACLANLEAQTRDMTTQVTLQVGEYNMLEALKKIAEEDEKKREACNITQMIQQQKREG